ncbi:MAG: hypothetical protein WD045_04535 [Pirellulaceae bacterium]
MRFVVRGKDADGTRLEMLVETSNPTTAVKTARRMRLSEIYVRPETETDGPAASSDHYADNGGSLAVRLAYLVVLITPPLIYFSLPTALIATAVLALLMAMALPRFPLKMPETAWGVELACSKLGGPAGRMTIVSLLLLNWVFPVLVMACLPVVGYLTPTNLNELTQLWLGKILATTEDWTWWPLVCMAVTWAFHLLITIPARLALSDQVRDHAWRVKSSPAPTESTAGTAKTNGHAV